MASTAFSLQVVTDTVSLRERTTEVLREAILRLHFKPGQKLVERKLCDDTGVSRTCVREALRHLEAEGLVRRAPNRGMFVAEVGWDEARQIYELRTIMESGIGRLFVARATPEQMTAIEASYRRIEKTVFSKDVLRYARALDAFSEALLDGAGNELARQILAQLRARITYLRTVTARAASREQKLRTLQGLREIVDALGRRDPDAAEEACRAYVRRSADFALTLLKTSPAAATQGADPRNERAAF